jgi:hypothetical protein
VLAGLIMIPAATSEIESTPMVYIPIELVSIAESTNVAPVFEEAEVSEVPVEAESEAAPAPAAAAATPDPEDTVALDPPKPEAPKAQPKPAAKPHSRAAIKIAVERTRRHSRERLEGHPRAQALKSQRRSPPAPVQARRASASAT